MTLLPTKAQPTPFSLPFAIRLRRDSPALPFLGPRTLPLGLLRLPLNPLPPRRAVLRRLPTERVAPRQLVQPRLVLPASAGHGHAPAPVRRTGRLAYALLAKPPPGRGHEPVQLSRHPGVAPPGGPSPCDRLLPPAQMRVVSFAGPALLSGGDRNLHLVQRGLAGLDRPGISMASRACCSVTSRT